MDMLIVRQMPRKLLQFVKKTYDKFSMLKLAPIRNLSFGASQQIQLPWFLFSSVELHAGWELLTWGATGRVGGLVIGL